MKNRPFGSMFPHLYLLSSLRNHLVAMILSCFENSLSHSLGFRRPLLDRNVLSQLLLIGEFWFSHGRRMFAFGVLVRPKAFLAWFFFLFIFYFACVREPTNFFFFLNKNITTNTAEIFLDFTSNLVKFWDYACFHWEKWKNTMTYTKTSSFLWWLLSSVIFFPLCGRLCRKCRILDRISNEVSNL